MQCEKTMLSLIVPLMFWISMSPSSAFSSWVSFHCALFQSSNWWQYFYCPFTNCPLLKFDILLFLWPFLYLEEWVYQKRNRCHWRLNLLFCHLQSYRCVLLHLNVSPPVRISASGWHKLNVTSGKTFKHSSGWITQQACLLVSILFAGWKDSSCQSDLHVVLTRHCDVLDGLFVCKTCSWPVISMLSLL